MLRFLRGPGAERKFFLRFFLQVEKFNYNVFSEIRQLPYCFCLLVKASLYKKFKMIY